MFGKFVTWHQELEREYLDVLARPELAQQVRPGLRRKLACYVAGLTAVERQQLASFSRKYMGWRSYAALGVVMLPFTLLGAFLPLLVPKLNVFMGMAIGAFAGFEAVAIGVTAWFTYSKFTGKNTLKWILTVFGWAVLGGVCGVAIAASDEPLMQVLAKLQRIAPVLLAGLAGATALFVLPTLVVGNLRAREAHLLAQDMMREANQQRLERELAEAQLRLLRAQIEPHFLFNTLGAVQQLAEEGAPRAAALTADLIAFLRATSTEMRRDKNTLREEFRLVQAYLNVMQARIGSRLRYSIDLPEALADREVPSMTVLTLAENAIKHGIEPALRGGEIAISARTEGADLAVTVSDSGAGMAPVPGKGMGLENVRSRIALIHGAAASLTLSDGEAGGVKAEMVLPGAAA